MNTITLVYPTKHFGEQWFTQIKRLNNLQWEWDPQYEKSSKLLRGINLPVFTSEIFRQYIQIFEKIFKSQEGEKINEKIFLENFKIEYYKSKFSNFFEITIYVKNKYIKDFKYGDKEVLAKFQMDEWDDDYLGTLESWGGLSSASNLTEEDLEEYINKLIAEYEEVTGEKYEKL